MAQKLTKKKKKRRGMSTRTFMLIASGVTALIVAVVLIATAPGSPPPDNVAAEQSIEPTFTPEPTESPNSRFIPAGKDGRLPVFRNSATTEKIVAITVDDLSEPANARQILNLAIEYGAKLTFFPIGEMAVKPKCAAVLKEAYEAGMEIENHTYTHNGLFSCSDEILAKEIYMQSVAVNNALGVNYHQHFLRPKGGDARNDERIHIYIRQLGFKGVAHWSDSGHTTAKNLINGLKPGNIYLFHTKDSDLQMLQGFIPWLAEQGYRMVTLNEMFGYPDNEVEPLTEPINPNKVQIPQIGPYTLQREELKKGRFAYAVKLLQDRLYELGYLTEPGDGDFGEGTEKAVKVFQSKAGLKATGIADEATQDALYAETAPAFG